MTDNETQSPVVGADQLVCPTIPRTDPSTGEPIVPTDGSTGPWWIRLERQYHLDAMVGPYTDYAVAVYALDNAILVDHLAHEDCLDCYITTDTPDPVQEEQFLIDMTNPDHTGEESDEPDSGESSPLRLIATGS